MFVSNVGNIRIPTFVLKVDRQLGPRMFMIRHLNELPISTGPLAVNVGFVGDIGRRVARGSPCRLPTPKQLLRARSALTRRRHRAHKTEVRIGYSLLLSLQASAAPPVIYDTRAVTQVCEHEAASADIVVCGRRDQDRYRIPRLAPDALTFGAANTSIGGIKAGIETERGNVGGIPTNRVMIKLRIPF